MIDVYVRKKDIPTECRKCPFLDHYDQCILQDVDANCAAEDFDELKKNCPLLTVEGAMV